MDPLSALSLAGNVVQLIDFGSKLLSGARELYKSPSGTLAAHHELELVTTDLSALVIKLRKSFDQGGGIESADQDATIQRRSFEQICDEAVKVAEELVQRLDKLKVKDGKLRTLRSLQHAVETAWSRQEKEDLKKRLLSLKDALETRVLFAIRYVRTVLCITFDLMSSRENLNDHSLRASARFDNLDQKTQQILSSLVDSTNTTTETSQEFREYMIAQTTTISQILSRVELLNQDNHHRSRDTILRCMAQELQALKAEDNRGQKGQLEKAYDITARIEMLNVSADTERMLRTAVQDAIFQSIQYPSMTDRYEDIVEAYPKTFEWAFHDPTEEQLPWSNISRWLELENGIYWVNGKAGSGKSTLMKHIFDDERTRRYLRCWAQDTPLCVATFFFWNSGTREQKSQVGLLRALLFQVLSQYPDLIQIMLPELWAKTYSHAANNYCKGGDLTHFWSLRQLMAKFRALVSGKGFPLKICLMIDGLDEFDGDDEQHEALANFFQEITETKNVKVCISSRPWPIFEDIFGQCPKLRLQNLTYGDIAHYVKGKLSQHQAFQRLLEQQPQDALLLGREIVNKADGVFLWVKLVVRSLLNGIRNRDDLPDLWERLRLMPKELEPLYSRLLDLIEPQYLSWASKAFQILRNTHKLSEFPFGKSSVARQGVSPLTLGVFFYAMKKGFAVQNLTSEEFGTRSEDIEVQLAARCAGLLEVSNVRDGYRSKTIGPDSLVQYFHRTTKDFLEKEEIWSKILMETNADFNPNFALMRGCYVFFQFGLDPTLVNDFMIYSYHADEHPESQHAQVALLDQMDDMMIAEAHWPIGAFPSGSMDNPDFLKHATVYGLRAYVTAKVTREGKSRQKERATVLLRYLLKKKKDRGIGNKPPTPRIEMVSRLLDLGADPNGSDGSLTAWEHLLGFLASESVGDSDFVGSDCDARFIVLRYLQIMEMLIRSGADLQAFVIGYGFGGRMTAADIVEKILMPEYPLEAASLMQVLQETMNRVK
jgi:hypothetical protein